MFFNWICPIVKLQKSNKKKHLLVLFEIFARSSNYKKATKKRFEHIFQLDLPDRQTTKKSNKKTFSTVVLFDIRNFSTGFARSSKGAVIEIYLEILNYCFFFFLTLMALSNDQRCIIYFYFLLLWRCPTIHVAFFRIQQRGRIQRFQLQ